MARAKPLVVDMDSHVLEPPDLWDNYLEEKYQDRSITVRKGDDGIEELIVDNQVLLKGALLFSILLGGVYILIPLLTLISKDFLL